MSGGLSLSDLDIYLWNFGTLELCFIFNRLQGYTLELTRTYYVYTPYDLFCNQTIPQHNTLTGKA